MSPSKPSRKGAKRARRPGSSSPAAESLHELEIESHHLRQVFRETLSAYGVALESEIAQLTGPIRERLEESGAGLSPKQGKILHQMMTLIRQLDIRPEKGRRKDLKRIEETVAQLNALAEKWLWME